MKEGPGQPSAKSRRSAAKPSPGVSECRRAAAIRKLQDLTVKAWRVVQQQFGKILIAQGQHHAQRARNGAGRGG